MTQKTKEFSYLPEAFEIIDKARGKPQTPQGLKQNTINLSTLILLEANRLKTPGEKQAQMSFYRLTQNINNKAFILSMASQCFHSENPKRVADQLVHLLYQFGVPGDIHWRHRFLFFLFKAFGTHLPGLCVYLLKKNLKEAMLPIIIPAEKEEFSKHILARKAEGCRPLIFHVSEHISGNIEANNQLRSYLYDLQNPLIEAISVKTLLLSFDRANLCSWDQTFTKITKSFREILQAAKDNPDRGAPKFVNFETNEYEDLELTAQAFMAVLDRPEFFDISAGISLQAYLPEAFATQQELLAWAQKRQSCGSAPIKICYVKGAFMAAEQVRASRFGHPQPHFLTKMQTDANFKRMLSTAALPQNARAAHIAIATHNIFDLAFALLLRAENDIDAYFDFAMFEGKAAHLRRVIETLSNSSITLYTPIVAKHEFINALPYVTRRMDEVIGLDNFLKYSWDMQPGTPHWIEQEQLFSQSFDLQKSVPSESRRPQNRYEKPLEPNLDIFENEQPTDFTRKHNREWAKEIIARLDNIELAPIPLVINGEELHTDQQINNCPAALHKTYLCSLANAKQLRAAITAAALQSQPENRLLPQECCILAKRLAQVLREKRDQLIAAMLLDGAKTVADADAEVCKSIDAIEYYRLRLNKISQVQDITLSPDGVVLIIASPGFSCSMPLGAITAAMLTGNSIIFKPSPQALLTSRLLITLLHEAAWPKNLVQFTPCGNDLVEEVLIADKRIDSALFSGRSRTGSKLIKSAPHLKISAFCDGKNAMIITAMADREMAVADLVASAFQYAGQKNSAISLAIIEDEVYDDPAFYNRLRDAAESIKTGLPQDLQTYVPPLLHKPDENLLRALTSLEKGEEWLLEPKADPDIPNLWSPGIKMGVRPGSFTHNTILAGPLLGLMRVSDFKEALDLAGSSPYGLITVLHSLDRREHTLFLDRMESGMLFINRPTTDIFIRRQPFGGIKSSSFGPAYKIGGPNFILHFLKLAQNGLPKEKMPINMRVNNLSAFLEKMDLSAEQLGIWYASAANYAFWWKRLKLGRDPTKIIGQDNIFRYLPKKQMTLRLENPHLFEGLRACAAALTCGTPLEVSWDASNSDWLYELPCLHHVKESEQEFLARVRLGKIKELRQVSSACGPLKDAAAEGACTVNDSPVLSNGRFELPKYLLENTISYDYHYYGHLGFREGELRKPLN